jgi:hypothetical protein
MMTLDQVLLSQYLDLKSKKWQTSGCGVASLLMLMRYLQVLGKNSNRRLPSADKLYQVGLNRRSYIKGVGWRHSGLVGLAKIYGFKNTKRYDLAKMSFDQALAKLKAELKTGPVLVSVFSKYEPWRGGHLVVLLSLNKTKAEVLDPDTKVRSAVYRKLPARKFLSAYKSRFIAVRP